MTDDEWDRILCIAAKLYDKEGNTISEDDFNRCLKNNININNCETYSDYLLCKKVQTL